MKTAQKIAAGAAIGVTFSLASLWLHHRGSFDEPEADTWKLRVRLLAGESNAPIKLILLDENSLAWATERGADWPWPRDFYTYILRFAREANVKAIAFDVQFTDGHLRVEGDEAFAMGIKQTPQLIMAMMPSDHAGVSEQWPANLPAAFHRVEGLDAWLNAHPSSNIVLSKARLPFKDFRNAAHLLAHVHGETGAGNFVSEIRPLHQFDGQPLLQLGLAAASLGDADRANGQWRLPALTLGDDGLHIGDRVVPMDDADHTLLHYYRPRQGSDYPFEVYTAADIIASGYALELGEEPVVDPATFRDSYVFFGFSAAALYDLKPTPFSNETPGVLLHATAAANLMEGRFITHAAPVGVFFWTLALSIGAAMGSVFSKRARQVVLISVVMLPLPIIAGLLAYKAQVWWPIIAPATAMIFALVGGIVLNYATEGKQRRFIRRAFERYLNPGVIDELVNDPEKLSLGGVERELSIFFADLSGFTSMSAVMSPAEITALLNSVLTEMTSVIFDENGTLDKYIGDAIVAFWNAPTDQPDHAVRAVRAAIRCQQKLDDKRATFERMAHGHSIAMRVGVHTGKVVVGNMGSQQQFNYSMIGDAANLASRLEGANKAFGTPIMVSQTTWAQTDGQFTGRVLANLQVVGRPEPIEVIQPIAIDNDDLNHADFKPFIDAIERGKSQGWRAALEALRQIEDDPAATAYAQYLADLKDGIDQWDGVWRLTKK